MCGLVNLSQVFSFDRSCWLCKNRPTKSTTNIVYGYSVRATHCRTYMYMFVAWKCYSTPFTKDNLNISIQWFFFLKYAGELHIISLKKKENWKQYKHKPQKTINKQVKSNCMLSFAGLTIHRWSKQLCFRFFIHTNIRLKYDFLTNNELWREFILG